MDDIMREKEEKVRGTGANINTVGFSKEKESKV